MSYTPQPPTENDEALKAAISDTNAAHEALAAFMKLEGDIDVTSRPGTTERTEIITSFQTGSLRAMLRADEREAFIGMGIAIMRQAKQALVQDYIFPEDSIVDGIRQTRALRSRTFKRLHDGNWLFRLARWALFKLMPSNTEVVLRKLN